jgi:hypothetical protein
MKNIYLENTKIHDNTGNNGIHVFPKIIGLESPDFRLPNFTRPNVDGAFVSHQLYGGRLITLTGKVYGETISEYRTNRRTLESAINIRRSNGLLLPITMKFKTMDDLELQIEAYTKSFIFSDENLLFGNFKLDLFAPSISIESQTLKAENLFIFQGGGMPIPMPIPMDMSEGGDVEQILINAGNIDAFPNLIFHGPIETPTLTNQTTGEAISLTNHLSSSDERVEIDIINRTALYFTTPTSSGANTRSTVSGDFLILQSGNNSMKLTTADSLDTGYVNIAWRDTYSGV